VRQTSCSPQANCAATNYFDEFSPVYLFLDVVFHYAPQVRLHWKGRFVQVIRLFSSLSALDSLGNKVENTLVETITSLAKIKEIGKQ